MAEQELKKKAPVVDFSKTPVDAMKIKDLIFNAEKAQGETRTVNAMFDSIAKAVYAALPIGIPFNCSRCRLDGFSADFLALAAGTCPNCKFQGQLTIRPSAPIGANGNLKDSIATIGGNVRMLQQWITDMPDRPELQKQAIDQLVDTLRSAGLFK